MMSASQEIGMILGIDAEARRSERERIMELFEAIKADVYRHVPSGSDAVAVQEVERDGKVAVLVSPGFGAGWSTWASDDIRESMCMNAEIVQAVLGGDKAKAAEIAERLHPDVYTGGAEDLVVKWVPKGEAFEITEYDGSESLVIIGQQTYMIA